MEIDTKITSHILGGGTLENGAITEKQTTTTTARRSKARIKKPEEPRPRWHSLVTYMSHSELEDFLKINSYWIKAWCWTYHDKDVEDDGVTPKIPHTHILLYTFNGKTSSSVRKIFTAYTKRLELQARERGDMSYVAQNTLTKDDMPPLMMYRYQLHLDDLNKYQYPKEDRHLSDVYFWKQFEQTDERSANIALEIFDSIMCGMSTRDLIANYGAEYVHNQRNYRALCELSDWESHHISQSFKDFNEMFEENVKDIVEDSPFPEKSQNDFLKIFNYVADKLRIEYGYNITYKERKE